MHSLSTALMPLAVGLAGAFLPAFASAAGPALEGKPAPEIDLPANAVGAPITYMAGGKQFIAFPTGGGPLTEELIAVALP